MPTDTVLTAASIVAGLLTRPQLAADLDCSDRTIIRYENAGLPVIRLGMLRFYNPAAVRAWLMTHERRHTTPRRGQPPAQHRGVVDRHVAAGGA